MNVSRSQDPEVTQKHSTLMGSTVDRSVGWRGQDIRGLEEDGDRRYRTFSWRPMGATEDPKEEEGAAEAHLRLCDCWWSSFRFLGRGLVSHLTSLIGYHS